MSEGVSVIDLMQKAKELSGNYENVVLSVINDHVLRISLMNAAPTPVFDREPSSRMQ